MDIESALQQTTQVKKYTNKKPPVEQIIKIVEAANQAFTHGNVHIVSFTIVDDPDTIKIIAESCQQQYIEKVPYVIVLTSNPKQLRRLFDVRAEKYTKHHVGAIAQMFLLKAATLGLSSSWVGAFSKPTISAALGTPDSAEIELIITVGYGMHEEKIKEKQRKKPELTGRLFFNAWGNRFYKPLKKIRRADI